MMNQVMGTWGTGMMLVNFLTGLLFLALLIMGIVAGVKWLTGQAQGQRQSTGNSPIDILKKRNTSVPPGDAHNGEGVPGVQEPRAQGLGGKY